MKVNLSSSFLFAIFFVALWFFSNTGYMLFPIFIALFFALLSLHLVLMKKIPSSNYISVGVGFALFYLVISLLHLSILPETYYLDDMLTDFVKMSMVFILTLFFYGFINNQRCNSILLKSLSFVLVVFLITFFVQVFLLYTKGYHLNYLEMIMGREQRISGTAGVKGIYRPSGMFNEPGSFTVSMYAVVFSRYLLNKKFDVLFWLGILATLVTLSAQAVLSFFLMISLFTAIYLFEILMRLKIKRKALYLSVLFFFFILILGFYFLDHIGLFVDYFINRFSTISGDGTVSVRSFALLNALQQSPITLVFGIGFNNNGLGYLINDTGFWFSSYSMFGVPALLVLTYFAFLIYKNHGSYALVMYLLIMLSKLVILYPVMALYFAALLTKNTTKVQNATYP